MVLFQRTIILMSLTIIPWIMKNMFLISSLSTECEKFYTAIEETRTTCVLILKNNESGNKTKEWWLIIPFFSRSNSHFCNFLENIVLCKPNLKKTRLPHTFYTAIVNYDDTNLWFLVHLSFGNISLWCLRRYGKLLKN